MSNETKCHKYYPYQVYKRFKDKRLSEVTEHKAENLRRCGSERLSRTGTAKHRVCHRVSPIVLEEKTKSVDVDG